jgi:hypothetical protein
MGWNSIFKDIFDDKPARDAVAAQKGTKVPFENDFIHHKSPFLFV